MAHLEGYCEVFFVMQDKDRISSYPMRYMTTCASVHVHVYISCAVHHVHTCVYTSTGCYTCARVYIHMRVLFFFQDNEIFSYLDNQEVSTLHASICTVHMYSTYVQYMHPYV